MLSAFFDIQSKDDRAGGGQVFGKSRSRAAHKGGKAPRSAAGNPDPRPREPGTTHMHAKFVPLPAETNVPKPAEAGGQAWQALTGSGVVRDDDVAEFKPEWDDDCTMWDDDEAREDMPDDVSEPDFEPESLDMDPGTADLDMSSSLEEDRSVASFFARRTKFCAKHEAAPVYSGPLLRLEDDDFND